MKVMMIAEQTESLSRYKNFFEDLGAQTVKYRNIAKALDNLDEIEPDGIVINVVDYPRQWKTVAEFLRGTEAVHLTCAPKLILSTEDSPYFDDTELEKSQILGVDYIIRDFDDVDETADLVEEFKIHDEPKVITKYVRDDTPIIFDSWDNPNPPEVDGGFAVSSTYEKDERAKAPTVPGSAVSGPKRSTLPETGVHFLFLCDGQPVTGKVTFYSAPVLYFVPEDQSWITSVRFGQIIEQSTIVDENGAVKACRVQVQEVDDDGIEFCLL